MLLHISDDNQLIEHPAALFFLITASSTKLQQAHAENLITSEHHTTIGIDEPEMWRTTTGIDEPKMWHALERLGGIDNKIVISNTITR